VIHHVPPGQFGVQFRRLAGVGGRMAEGPAARLAYRHHACVAVSPSTVTAMRERLRWRGDIYLSRWGTSAPPAAPSRRSLVMVGRLVAHKRAERILPSLSGWAAVASPSTWWARGRIGGARCDIAARGLTGTVQLHGFLPEAKSRRS